MPATPDLLANLPESLAHDPDIYNAIKSLVLDAIDEAREILDTAAPTNKLNLIRILLPAASRALSARQDSDGLDELRERIDTMYEAMRQGMGVGESGNGIPDTPG